MSLVKYFQWQPSSITSSTIGVCSTGGYVTTLSASKIKHCTVGSYAGAISNSKFGYLSLGGDGNFGVANIMDSLKFSAGNIYTFQSAAINTITSQWSAISPACSGLTEVKSNTPGSQATILFTGAPTVTLTNVIVRDMKATGSYSLIGTGFDNGNNTNFIIASPASNSLYWVGGSGNWNDALHWSFSSGGPGGACIPTPADNVFFNSGSNLPANTSFTVTVGGSLPSYCHNMVWNGAPGSPLLTGSALTTPLNVYGSFTLQSGMNYKVSYTNCSSKVIGETITTNGVVLGYQGTFTNDKGLYIENGGGYGFTDNYNSVTSLFLSKGALTTNNNLVIIYEFTGGAVSPVTTTLTLGTSTINVASNWMYQGTGTTLSAASSWFNMNNNGVAIFKTSGGHIYNVAVFTSTASSADLYAPDNVYFKRIICNGLTTANSIKGPWAPGNNTLKYVAIAGHANIVDHNNIGYLSIGGNSSYSGNGGIASIIDTLIYTAPSKVHTFVSGSTTTIRKLWSAIGTDCTLMTQIVSSTSGTQATISFSGTPTVTLTNVMVKDTRATGAITPISCTGLDLGNNTGFSIINPAAKTLYWVGGNGNWNDPDHWSTVNNGVYPSGVNGCVPTRVDDVVFGTLSNTLTSTSFTTIISGTAAECHNITWAGAPGNPALSDASSTIPLNIYGSSIWQTGMIYFVYTTNYLSTSSETITSNNVNMTGLNGSGQAGSIFVSNGGRYVFSDNFKTSCIVYLSKGGINTNNKSVTMLSFSGGATLPTTTTLTLGTSTVTLLNSMLSAATVCWGYNGTGASLSAGSSHITGVNGFVSSGVTGSPFLYNNVTLSSLGYYIGNVSGNYLTFNNVKFITDGRINGNTINANLVTTNGAGSVIGNSMIDSLMIAATGTITGTHLINHCEITGVATVTGTNTISYLSMRSNGFMNGNNISDTLIFNTGATYVLESAKTQTVTSRLYASGYSCAPIIIKSSMAGTAANLRVLAGRTDFYYGRITDINASALTFTYGIGSNNFGGNSNIVFDPVSTPFSSGLGPDLLLGCSQYPYVINTTNFSASPLASYSWSGTGGTGSGSTFTATGPGTYSVIVAYSPGCVLGDAIVLTRTSLQPVTASVTQTLICSGLSSTLLASGVSSYTWSTGATTSSTSVSPSVTTIYTVTGTDSNGCLDTKTVSVNVNTSPAITLSAISNASICLGNNTIITPGGASTYTLLNTGISATSFTLNPGATTTYSIVGTSTQNCQSANTLTTLVTVNALPVISASTQTNVLCFGGATGAASITVTGGVPAYSYSWSPGVSSTTNIANGLSMGTYTATVKDANNCVATRSISILQPVALGLLSISNHSVSCFGTSTGSIQIIPTGGTPAYTYSWSPPISSSSNTAIGLAAGNYTAIVRDANLCTLTQSFVITQPASALSVSSVVSASVACFGASTGSAQITPAGGTPGYTYSWLPGISSVTNTATGLAAGNYTAIIKDANLCTSTRTFVIIQPASSLSIVSTSSTNVACFGTSTGSAAVMATGGTPAYTYSWSPGLSSTTSSVTGLATGNYTATVTDANLCSITRFFVISEPTALVASVTNTTQASCGLANGTATIMVSGGTPVYTYSWTPPLPASSFTTATSTSTNLIAGITQVNVMDINGCLTSLFVTITNPNAPVITPTQTNVLCYGFATGVAEASVTAGTAPYTYSWSPSVSSSTNSVSGLTSGNYIITVMDAVNCSVGYAFTITQPIAPLTATAVATSSVLCYGASTGSVTVSITGGTPSYVINWENNTSTTNSATAYAAGNYTYQVTDANGCKTSHPFVITQPAAPLSISSFTQTKVLCFGEQTGAVDVSVTGGNPGYRYLWQPGNIMTSGLNNVPAGSYTLVVQDSRSCTTHSIFSVDEAATKLSTHVVNSIKATCELNNGSIMVMSNGGSPNYIYQWNTGAQGPELSNVSAGNYTVITTDVNGCLNTLSIALDCETGLFIPELFSPNADGKNDKFEIKTISNYPNNTLQIFNRWGSLVYEKYGYNNEWDGKASAGDTMGKSLLPKGTYYLVLDFGDDDRTKSYRGFVELVY